MMKEKQGRIHDILRCILRMRKRKKEKAQNAEKKKVLREESPISKTPLQTTEQEITL